MNKCESCQIRWERDQAMEQLEEHHIPFGCVADDVVEVIRCKDCKHYVIHILFGHQQGWCERLCDEFDKSLARGTMDNDFCSRGERRSE